jgi:hypothetical protein
VTAVLIVVALVALGLLAAHFVPGISDRSEPTPTPSRQPDLIESRMRERVVVTLTSGEAFAGVLWEADERAWVLRSAEALGPDKRPIPVDGELIFLTATIAYANKP